jgi:proteic killer suppression protein
MEIQFNNPYLEKLYAGLQVSGKPKYNEDVIEKFRRRVVILEQTENTSELRKLKSLHFEALKGDKKGLYSIRVDLKYQLEFYLEKDAIKLSEIVLIDSLSNHYK